MKIRRFMKKRFRYGEKGFTLIELLIVVAILGILAAVIVPNLATFLGTGKVAAANTEVANVETAALAYYADNDGIWPDGTNTPAGTCLRDPPGGDPYISADAVDDYTFDTYGQAVPDGTAGWGTDTALVWVTDQWEKA